MAVIMDTQRQATWTNIGTNVEMSTTIGDVLDTANLNYTVSKRPIYLDGNVKANLDFDIVPEIGAGIIIKEKFYGQIGVDYSNSKVNPHAKIGIRWELF